MPEGTLSLAQAIKDLRDELYEAQQYRGKDANNALKFEIVDINLELHLVATDSAKAGGKIGWSLFGAEASIDGSEAKTHKLCLKLQVAQAGSGPVKIGEDASNISHLPLANP